MQYRFHHAIVGGTFDRFHAGHQALIIKAFEESKKVSVGIATDALFNHKTYAHIIEDFTTRKKTVSKFLSKRGFSNRAEIVPISDFYGTTLTEKNLDAIFITESNQKNVFEINEVRGKKGFLPLEVITVPYVLGNDGEIITSERVRKGIIDRDGKSYGALFDKKEQFILPDTQRQSLRQPLGEIATDPQGVIASFMPSSLIIAVGDIVAASLKKNGRQAAISIIDGKTQRRTIKHAFSSGASMVTAKNPAGTITKEAVNALKKALTNYHTAWGKQVVMIDGEEDLLAIPAILLSPLQTIVVYGQVDKGMVVISVSEEIKKYVKSLFEKFH